MVGSDFEALEAAGYFPSSAIPSLVEPTPAGPSTEAEVAEAVERALSDPTADVAHVQEGLAHTTTLLVDTQPTAVVPTYQVELNEHGYPKTKPLPIIHPNIVPRED
jgi:hypothetical protein